MRSSLKDYYKLHYHPRASNRRFAANPEPGMANIKLDAIDLKILRDLQDNGRMTNVELSQRAGISAPPCLRRVRALEEAGYLRGYHAEVDIAQMGWEVVFFALVGLDSQSDAVLSGFEAMVGAWPEVRACHMVRGGGDFLLKLVARNTAHENALTTKLTAAPNVVRVTTFPAIRTSKDLPGVPINPDAADGFGA